MEDKDNKKGAEENGAGEIPSADVKIKIPVSEKLSNFWYYYKWHTLVVLFAVIVAVVLVVQCCSREKYDIYILYAGDKAISNSSSDGDVPERTKFINSFGKVCDDFDGDGKVSVAFKSLYNPDADELARREAEGLEIPSSLIQQDRETLSTLIAQSDYYLLFLDYAVFEELAQSTAMIDAVDGYLPQDFGAAVVRVNNSSGVYLKDTGFYEMEGIRDLPSDTVICIKHTGAFASDADKEKKNDAVAVFKKILAF